MGPLRREHGAAPRAATHMDVAALGRPDLRDSCASRTAQVHRRRGDRQGWREVGQRQEQLPRARMARAVNFVSGPSRTADIEQTVTLGAHGPYRVCIVLVSDRL
jgi:hypothetical protein